MGGGNHLIKKSAAKLVQISRRYFRRKMVFKPLAKNSYQRKSTFIIWPKTFSGMVRDKQAGLLK